MDIKGGKVQVKDSFVEKVEGKKEEEFVQVQNPNVNVQDQLATVLSLLAKDAEGRNEERAERAAKLEAQARARVEAAKAELENKGEEQRRCRHQKQDGRPRIGGQQLSDGTFVYFCQWCQKRWQYPLQEGMEALPAHLQNLNGDMIGSAIR